MIVLEHAGETLPDPVTSNLSFDERVDVVRHILDATAYLRLLGIVHADISVENCCIDKFGRAPLIDFGNAVLFDGAPSKASTPARLQKLRSRYIHHPRFPAAERYAHPLSVKQMIIGIERHCGMDVYQRQ